VQAVSFDDLAHGLRTAEDAGLLSLLEEGLQGGEGLRGTMEFEGPQREGLQQKLRQKFIVAHAPWSLIAEQNLFDSNFSGAAFSALTTSFCKAPGALARGWSVRYWFCLVTSVWSVASFVCRASLTSVAV
jgi:hypothetical protein